MVMLLLLLLLPGGGNLDLPVVIHAFGTRRCGRLGVVLVSLWHARAAFSGRKTAGPSTDRRIDGNGYYNNTILKAYTALSAWEYSTCICTVALITRGVFML